VAFTSDATNLVQGDTNDSADVFVRDLVEQTTRRVSVASDGSQADRWSGHVAISGDGRYVTFASAASTLSPRDPRRDADIFVHDLASGRTRWVSELGGRTQGGTSLGPDISEHGRFVVFNSSQDRVDVSSVCSADHNVYLWDRSTRTTRCLSPTYDGSDTYGEVSYGAQIDAHGTAVAFTSTVYRLVPHDVDVNAPNVFLWRRPVETDR
jgi:Tol biopolymer transport system component